jgi:hypothetical protein
MTGDQGQLTHIGDRSGNRLLAVALLSGATAARRLRRDRPHVRCHPSRSSIGRPQGTRLGRYLRERPWRWALVVVLAARRLGWHLGRSPVSIPAGVRALPLSAQAGTSTLGLAAVAGLVLTMAIGIACLSLLPMTQLGAGTGAATISHA